MSNVTYGSSATEKRLLTEATEYGVAVIVSKFGYIQFRKEGASEVLSWMSPSFQKGMWRGCDGKNSFTGRKNEVANWCLDVAVNGQV